MTEEPRRRSGDVEPFPKKRSATELTDRLNDTLAMLRSEFPEAASISLEFNGRLQAHIDVRKGEHVPMVEYRLAGMGGGMFTHIAHGAKPLSPFHHRISATVNR